LISTQEYSTDFYSVPMSTRDIDTIEKILQRDLIRSGVQSALLIDTAGNIIAKSDNGRCNFDLYSLAALASANFAAVEAMANLLGDMGFSLLFHGGSKENTHFSKITDEIILISIFSKKIPLGDLRLRIARVAKKIKRLWHIQ